VSLFVLTAGQLGEALKIGLMKRRGLGRLPGVRAFAAGAPAGFDRRFWYDRGRNPSRDFPEFIAACRPGRPDYIRVRLSVSHAAF